uniref:EOG090X04Z9 n=1 Tax=Lynceus sp. MCZ IZ 141354 TaxID=1930659 RepID=A0A9N6WVQ2_9CRUS|nr:EOG090X04Z9 [Lynceus sp. MCZ IZ 141354]
MDEENNSKRSGEDGNRTESVNIPKRSGDCQDEGERRTSDLENTPTKEPGKRVRTDSSSWAPTIPASPPRFISLEELMKAANGISNMSLAHEIAVDNEFQLKKIEPTEDSLHKRVKEMMHKAFWDILEEELKQDPPEINQALVLLEEIRTNLLSLLLPHQVKSQQEVREKLDLDLVRQQAESGTLNFQDYAQYIVGLMGRLCAPERDDKIRELTQLREIVPLYKGILETLDLMKLDMANFTIRQIRPHIVACSVEYERKKFEEYLKITPDGLQHTREWLQRHNPESPMDKHKAVSQIIVDSFMELLVWDETHPFPETLAMDEARFKDLKEKVLSLEILGSSLLISFSQVAPHLQTQESFRKNLKDTFTTLLSNVRQEEELKIVMPNLAVQVQKEVTLEHEIFTDANLQNLTQQLTDVASPSHRIRQLVRSRLLEFLKQVISSETARPTQIPPGLSVLRNELAALAGQFARLVSHNRAVFAPHYLSIIEQYCPPTTS